MVWPGCGLKFGWRHKKNALIKCTIEDEPMLAPPLILICVCSTNTSLAKASLPPMLAPPLILISVCSTCYHDQHQHHCRASSSFALLIIMIVSDFFFCACLLHHHHLMCRSVEVCLVSLVLRCVSKYMHTIMLVLLCILKG